MQRFSLYGVHKRDYQESVTTGQTDTRTHRQTPDKVIPMCRYASQATQKIVLSLFCSTSYYMYMMYMYKAYRDTYRIVSSVLWYVSYCDVPVSFHPYKLCNYNLL